jgi:hypothetical protein
LLVLHDEQADTTFPGVERPPLISGITWSPVPAGLEQYEHR